MRRVLGWLVFLSLQSSLLAQASPSIKTLSHLPSWNGTVTLSSQKELQRQVNWMVFTHYVEDRYFEMLAAELFYEYFFLFS